MPTGYSKDTGQNPFKGVKRNFSRKQRKALSDKMRKMRKGKKPWNKGLTLKPHSDKTKIKMSKAHHKRPSRAIPKAKCKACKKTLSTYHYSHCSKCSHKIMVGKLAANWRGGKGSLYMRIRGCVKYKKWRDRVLARDKGKCVLCKSKECVEVDHIISFNRILKTVLGKTKEQKYKNAMSCRLFWLTKNGRVLCKTCHKKTKDYGRRKKKN